MSNSKYYILTALSRFFLTLMVVTSLPEETYGQDSEIYYVKFDFYHSLRIPNHHVLVEFNRFGDSISVHVRSEPMNNHSEEWNKTELDYSFELVKSEFDNIVEVVQKIRCTDIATGLGFTGKDGTTCKISYGGISSEISYKVWTPNYDTKKRNLKDFMEACILILKTAKFDPKKIL